MNEVDKMLEAKGLKFEDLDKKERDVYFSWISAIEGNNITIESVKQFISDSRRSVELELSEIDDVPTSWLSVVALFIPIYGLIRKWYSDRKKIGLQMRLRNYVLLENMLLAPEKAREAVKSQIAAIPNRKT